VRPWLDQRQVAGKGLAGDGEGKGTRRIQINDTRRGSVVSGLM
jgi:hypothetical protein